MSVGLASLRVAESETPRSAFAPQGEDTMSTRYEVAPGYRVNVRSGPSTKYPIVRVLPLGATIAINCQKYGEWINGPYGTTNIWDNIAPGEYVSDAYVHTGSDDLVAPRCS
ncbi:peptidase [Streptomyces sp. NPDC093089]|uniref:peptidase n=1 Tax=Streptomyces sp. NPDC093089 TaxID=3366024 RepID=UPI0037FEB168